MHEILKMLFESIFNKSSGVEKIKTIEDLCNAVWDSSKIARIFAAMNDSRGDFSTADILEIADEAYQEVCVNG